MTDGASDEKTVIVVGGSHGFGRTIHPLQSTEIYDDVTSTWRSGPELPDGIALGVLVEDLSGGVVLIGGYSFKIPYLDTLYRLSHAGMAIQWKPLNVVTLRQI